MAAIFVNENVILRYPTLSLLTNFRNIYKSMIFWSLRIYWLWNRKVKLNKLGHTTCYGHFCTGIYDSYPLKLEFFNIEHKIGIYSPNPRQRCNFACWIQSNVQFFSTRYSNSQHPRWRSFCKWNWNIAFADLFSDTKLDTHSPNHGQRCNFACWIRSNDQIFYTMYSNSQNPRWRPFL